MAESYSVQAVLSAKDDGFSSAFKSASSVTESLGSKIKSGLGFGALMAVGQKAISTISGSLSGLVSEIDSSNAAWKVFESNMSMTGMSTDAITSVKNELQDFATQTIYSASDMASTYAQLAAVGTKNTTALVKGFGGLASAAQEPSQAMKTLSQQATQMAAKPKVEWQDFKLMLEQTPAGVAAVAKQMGMSAAEMVSAVQDGEIATQDFFDAVSQVGTNEEFTKLATQYKTVGEAMDGLTETVSNKLQPAFETLTQVGINAVSGLSDALDGINADALASKISDMVSTASEYLAVLKEDFSKVAPAFQDAAGAIGESLQKVTHGFDKADALDAFKNAMDSASDALVKFAGFCEEHSDTIAKLITLLPKIAVGFMAFKVLKTVVPFASLFTSAIGGLAKKGLGGLASKLFGVAGAEKATGTAAGASAKELMQVAAAFLAMSGGILLISTGLALIAQSAIALANAGGGAIAVAVGMAAALAGLVVSLALFMKYLSASPAKATAMATVLLAVGASVLMVAAGFAILTQCAIALTEAGTPAIAMFAAMVIAVGALMALVSVLGESLVVGGAGLVLMGAGLLLVATAALVAGVALNVVALALPTIVEYAVSGTAALVALGVGLAAFGVGAAVAGVACVVLGAGLAVVAVAVAALGVGLLVVAAAVVVLSAGLLLAGASALVAGTALNVIASALPKLVTYGTAGAAAILALGVALVAFGATSAAAVLAMTASMAAASVGIAAFAVAGTAASAGFLALGTSLGGVKKKMASIADSTETVSSSFKSMKNSLKSIPDGFSQITTAAKSAQSGFTSAVTAMGTASASAGTQIGSRLATGIASSSAQVVSASKSMATASTNAMRGGYSSALASGKYIGQGLAIGLRSSYSQVAQAAAQLAKAADEAIRAKAKIGSPSRVAIKTFSWIGKGAAIGLEDTKGIVKSAAFDLFSMPEITQPELALIGGGSMSLNDGYNYSSNSTYTFEIPVTVDGKQVAKATATYTQDELNRLEKLSKYRKGEK